MRIKERFAHLTARRFQAPNNAPDLGNIALVASGTVVASVASTSVKSGDLVFLQPLQYAGNVLTITASKFLMPFPTSVRAGAFEITMQGSNAPADTLPVAWFVIHKA